MRMGEGFDEMLRVLDKWICIQQRRRKPTHYEDKQDPYEIILNTRSLHPN